MKKQLLLFLIMALPVLVSAQEVVVDGIRYSLSGNTASVTRNLYQGDIVIPSSFYYEGAEYSVTSIGNRAFSDCTSLTSVTIPNSVTSIAIYAFRGCTGLTSVTIPNSLTSIGQCAFEGCTGLTSIQVESGNTVFDSRDNCNAIINTASNELIYGCKGTVIPASVTSIGGYAFYDCSSLTSVTIPNSVTSIGESAFCNCKSLTSVIIPASVTSIGNRAFRGCISLTSIQVESGNTVFDSRDNCNAIINTVSNELIYGCKGTVIPNGVTSIGESAFYDCSGLTSMTIPASVTSIGKNAFVGCKLEKIVCRCPLANAYNVFSEATCNHAVLYVPEGKRWEAIYDGGWYLFSNIRETAMDVNDLSRDKAYTLMNAQTFNYSAYDAVNSEVKIIKDFYNLDEGVAYNSWQIIEREGKKFLYNIGAQKYAQMNSLGEWEMTNAPTPLSLKSDVDGRITVNEQASQWFFVLNEQVSVNHDATAIDPISENMGNAKSRYYTVEGKRVDSNKKGLVLVVSDDGTRKKVVMK